MTFATDNTTANKLTPPDHPLSQQTEWRAGEVLAFDLALFGAACELAPVMLRAFTAGETLGLGPARTPSRFSASCRDCLDTNG